MTIWDYALGQESIRIEEVVGDEVVSLVAELPIGQDEAAEALCNAHNKYAKDLSEGDYILTDRAAWFTVGSLSVRIRAEATNYIASEESDRLIVSIYPLGREDDECLADCGAFFSDAEEQEANS